jgi:glycerol uptake facilitator protein
MNPYVAELVGTALLIILGNGVVANVVLERTKGASAGWIVITAGWALAVFTAVMCVGQYSGAHLNPAVAAGLVVRGTFPFADAPGYVAAQMAGAMLGAAAVYVFYKPHYDITADAGAKLATFCTAPNIRHLPGNLFCEMIGTFVLVFAVLLAEPATLEMNQEKLPVGLGSLGAMPVGLVVFAIGLSLGGTTGYAINPARDLGPRIAHALLPIAGKGSSGWDYAPVPVIGPLAGGVLAALACRLLAASSGA